LATSALASPAVAQQATTVPFPVRQYTDENGVDLLSGSFTIVPPSISIGDDQMGLNFLRRVRTSVFRDNMAWNIAINGSTYTVAVPTGSDAFTLSGSTFTPIENNGSSLTYNSGTSTYTYTTRDGTVASFVQRPFSFFFGNATNLSANTITYPNGKILTFYYLEGSYVDAHGTTRFGRRLQAVTSNTGYMIHPAYASDTPSPTLLWSQMNSVKALNTSVDTCSPNDLSCPETGRPTLNMTTGSYTDSEGRVTQFTVSGGNVVGVKLPGSASNDISVSYTSAKVTSITRFGVTTTYAYSDVSGIRTVTVTRPGGSTRVATFNLAKNIMLTDQNELGKTTSYEYDSNNRPTRVTQPEGNYTQITYGTRGNITEQRNVAKSGSGLSDIVATASYDTTCANVKTCNQPNWTKDALNNQTDYIYDSTHGGMLTMTEPAPTIGAVRPQTRITWTRLGANGLPSGTGVFMPTGLSECQTLSSCAAVADEVKTIVAYGQGLLPSSISKGDGTGGLTATNSLTYDVIGNLTYADGPLAGTADTTRALYNQDREMVGAISPDPDGAGSLKNRAIRTTYGSTGLVTKRELGTTNGQGDADRTAFSSAQAVELGYDSNRRPATQKLSSGGTDYALTQASYDNRGRLQCSAVRMNVAIYGSLPSDACTLGTQGSFGSDRITQASYDNASQITQVQVAVGTADAANERTLTWSDNGKLRTLLDGENNKTTYVYDGFDRLSQTQYPNTTKGSGTSNASDYEQLTYDADGNVTSRRLRDATSIGYTYDKLNRVTLKDLPGGEPDVTYGYDNLDRPTSANQTGNALSFAYDALSRKLTEVGPQGTATSEYDLASRRTKLTYPGTGLYVNTDYLVTGEVTAIRENGASSGVGVLAAYAYENLGNRTSVTFGNGVSQAYTFDAVSRLGSLTNDLSGTSNDLSAVFGYNPSSNINSTVRTGDAYAWTDHNNINRGYTSNGLNQHTAAGPASFTYDARGNLTSDGTSAFSYSSENLLTSTPGSTTLAYDPMLRLYQIAGAATTRFAYDGLNMIAEYDGSNALQRRFVFAPGIDQPILQYEGTGTTDRRFMSSDERGSVISSTDSSGALLNINRYDEYGTPQTTNSGRFGYIGQAWLGEIGMQYSKARIYSPTLGRFLQTDPVGYGDGPNWYAYVLNDPVSNADPTGLTQCERGAICVTAPRTCNVACALEKLRRLRSGPVTTTSEGGSSNSKSRKSRCKAEAVAALDATTSRIVGVIGTPIFDSPSEVELLEQYFRGDATPYHLNAAEWAQAKSYVAMHPNAVGPGVTSRLIYFSAYPGDAPLLDALLGIATGTFIGDELVGISDTFNFDYKAGRGDDLGGVLANLGVFVIRQDAKGCAGDINIPVTGGP
jgi:RHS repeat-associated protein